MSRLPLLGLLCVLWCLLNPLASAPLWFQPGIDLCADPRLDAAVSLSEAHVLLFKASSMWVLDLTNYRLDPVRSNSYLLDACLDSTTPQELMDDPYYMWNRHGDYMFYKNQICIDRAGSVCQLFLEVSNETNEFVGQRKLPVAAFSPSGHMDNCVDNLSPSESTINMLIVRKSFFDPSSLKTKSLLLIGKYFRASVTYQLASTYDPNSVLIKVYLKKFDRELDSAENGPCPEKSLDQDKETRGNVKELCISGVYTFVVLPHGDLMIFFEQEFCFIQFYIFRCNRRDLRELIGCTTPRESVVENEVHILHAMAYKRASVGSNNTNADYWSTEWSDGGAISTEATGNSSLVSARAVVGGNNSSGVSTLSIVEQTGTTLPTPIAFAPTTTRSSVSLFTLPNWTSANVTTQGAGTPPVSTNIATTRTVSSAGPDNYSPPSRDHPPHSSSEPYDIDFLYRKRDSFKHDLIERRKAEVHHAEQLLADWPHFLRIGLVTCSYILVRALLFCASAALSCLLFVALLLAVLHPSKNFNFQVIFLILKSLFLRKLSFY